MAPVAQAIRNQEMSRIYFFVDLISKRASLDITILCFFGLSGIIFCQFPPMETLSFEGRQAVVDTLIKVIRIADGNIEITWNI